jgi:hypothetical protein
MENQHLSKPIRNLSSYIIALDILKSNEFIGLGVTDIHRHTGISIYLIKRIILEGHFTLQERYNINGEKKCSNCNYFLPVNKFQNSSRTKDGLRGMCKKCRKDTDPNYMVNLSNWREANKHRKAEMDRSYRERNLEKIKAYRNTEKAKEFKRRSDKKYYEKMMSNPLLKLKARLKSQISLAVSKGVKKSKTLDILGYTIDDLKQHLESNFAEGMSWDNYGRNGWHIDHIKPLVLFKLDTEDSIKEAWSLSNLQPLWEKDNLSKNSIYEGVMHRYPSFCIFA